MKHRFKIEGYSFRLRPVELSDAEFIVEVRLEDETRNKFIHNISHEPEQQRKWINEYFIRENDFYFVVENKFTCKPEGLISVYNFSDNSAEWGRWVIKKGSMAAAESIYLLYKISFEQIGLTELFCRTIEDNVGVVSFHNSIGEKTRKVLNDFFELNGKLYDAVEQYSDKENFYSNVEPILKRQILSIYNRNIKRFFGRLTFHHVGVATKSIERELPVYRMLGYNENGGCFVDENQGIKGLFITSASAPRLELLENLPGRSTLDIHLQNSSKYYHIAYCVDDIETALNVFKLNRAKIISELKPSTYFGKRICFIMLQNMSLIELIEN